MVVITILLIVSLFVLRRGEPDVPRPFRAWTYPYAPLLLLIIAVLLFFGYIVSNPYPSLYALVLLSVSYLVFRLRQEGPPLAGPGVLVVMNTGKELE